MFRRGFFLIREKVHYKIPPWLYIPALDYTTIQIE